MFIFIICLLMNGSSARAMVFVLFIYVFGELNSISHKRTDDTDLDIDTGMGTYLNE